MVIVMDAYEELGLDGVGSHAVSHNEIKAAYQRLARELHPDKCVDKSAAAAERFLRVQAAWKALGTADARADYDASAVRAHASVTNAERVLLSELEAALVHDGQDDGYQRQCRCGDCYEISAQDLADGFNTVQCNGCSLYITVA